MSSTGAKVLVGIDFGTTYSGCAYALRDDPSKVYSVYRWPETDNTYCKTKTDLYYSQNDMGRFVLKSWGAQALIDLTQADSSSSGKLIKNFKLHLADSNQYGSDSPATPLTGNLTKDIVITDYLHKISSCCIEYLRETLGSEFSIQDVQWCLTVPAIWSDSAKQLMKTYAEAAGLVQRRNSNKSSTTNEGSPYPLFIVLEPEAAAVYCLREFNRLSYDKGDKFMTVDLGGGTVDIVVHQKVWQSSSDDSNLEMKEVAKSSGGLCGSTYVDREFTRHLNARIPCFNEFMGKNHDVLVDILTWWEGRKVSFNGTLSQRWLVPSNLADAWKLYDQKAGCYSDAKDYGQIMFTAENLVGIFEPVVKRVIELIQEALRPFPDGEVKTIMAVGGFSGNPYLKKRLRAAFTPRLVKDILVPSNPGGAICNGAVMLALASKDLIVSRVSRKTYGQVIRENWKVDDPVEFQITDDDGVLVCDNVFQIFVRKGQEVPSRHEVTRTLAPIQHNQRTMRIGIYSSEESRDPKFTTDAGVKRESQFVLDISSGMHLDKARKVAVTMYFGRTSIEVTAKGLNFDASGGADKAIPVAFEADAIHNSANSELSLEHPQQGSPTRSERQDAVPQRISALYPSTVQEPPEKPPNAIPSPPSAKSLRARQFTPRLSRWHISSGGGSVKVRSGEPGEGTAKVRQPGHKEDAC